MRVLRERDALRRVVEQPRKAAPHLLGLLEREVPDVIDMLGRVEPRLTGMRRLNTYHAFQHHVAVVR